MTQMTKGANIPLAASALRATLLWSGGAGVPDVDTSALLLESDGQVSADEDFVYYNQPHHPSGCVRHLGKSSAGQTTDVMEIDLGQVPAQFDRIVLAASADGGTFGQVPGLALVIADRVSGSDLAAFPMTASAETAFVCGELYRHSGAWKFRAVGQGYSSGLAGLAADYGIAVDDPSAVTQAAEPVAAAPITPVMPVVAPPVVAAPVAPVVPPPVTPEPVAAPPPPQPEPQPVAAPLVLTPPQVADAPQAPAPPIAPPPPPVAPLPPLAPPPVAPLPPLAPPAPPVPPAPDYGPPVAYPPPAAAPPPQYAPLPGPPAPPVAYPPQPAAPTTVPQPSPNVLSLRRNEPAAQLMNPDGSPLNRLVVAAGWYPVQGLANVDLDASVIAFDGEGNKLEIVWHRNANEFMGALQHTGDSKTGAVDGDAEAILVDLARLPDQVAALVFTINSFTGQRFTDIAHAYFRMVDHLTGAELVRFDLTDSQPSTAVLMTMVRRCGPGAWDVRAIGEFHDTRFVKKLVGPAARHVTMR